MEAKPRTISSTVPLYRSSTSISWNFPIGIAFSSNKSRRSMIRHRDAVSHPKPPHTPPLFSNSTSTFRVGRFRLHYAATMGSRYYEEKPHISIILLMLAAAIWLVLDRKRRNEHEIYSVLGYWCKIFSCIFYWFILNSYFIET